jgi:hypothetical protein
MGVARISWGLLLHRQAMEGFADVLAHLGGDGEVAGA